MISNDNKPSFLEQTGKYLILAAILGFALAIILSFFPKLILYSNGIASDGTLAAVSTIFLLIGSAFGMPGLLKDGSKGSYSSMRFLVLTVVLVFATITIKIGWQTSSFEDFKIDNTWVYILGLAFGGKVAQTFTEEKSPTSEEEEPKDPATGS